MDEMVDRLLDILADKLTERLSAGHKELYTAKELAERYGVSCATIRSKMAAGEFGELVSVGERTRLVPWAGVQLMQHLTRSGNTVPTVAAGMRPTAGCPRRWAPRLNLRILECSMWTSAARWSASCEKKGTSYGRFERPDHRYPG